MSVEQRYVYRCDSCGAETTEPDSRWLFLTQPSRAFCNKCKPDGIMVSSEPYDEDYYLRGKQTGKSLYEDFRWLPDLTVPMAQRIVDHCGIERGDQVLDFGCARGYVVKALRQLGYRAWGIDASRWAVANCDPDVRDFVFHAVEPQAGGEFDWIIAKDVLEHIEYVERTVHGIMHSARKGAFVVVPLSTFDGRRYVIDEYEKDVTHCQRMSLLSWARMFLRPEWTVTVQYRLPGIKDNWYKPGMERGNGFITARRIECTV